ncbi:hypothetical protein GQ53DRAFT_822387 [Thozetella sp. PMI_491]|nr:hypothetical protein GQ53DRAFT_822387 [Thozetella sp. PMI_491]
MENPEALTVRGLEYFAYWQFCYALAIGFVKSSICVALLRLTPDRRYRIPLWIIIVSAGCTSLGGLISFVLAIATDLFCAVVPWFIIRKLQLPRRARYSDIVVLGIGVIASIGSAMRIPYLKAYSATDNYLYGYGYVVLWSLVESGLGLAAGSLPPLGKLFVFFRETSTASSGSNLLPGAGGNRTVGGTPFSTLGTQLDDLTPSRFRQTPVQKSVSRNWDCLDDDACSR